MDKSQSAMKNTKYFQVSYRRAGHHRSRYIHKYYLPIDLKARIFVADIKALMNELKDWNIYKQEIPDTLPCCVMYYTDLFLEKTISAQEVEQILLAICSYHADLKGELTEEEDRAAINLNAWLAEWEKGVLAEHLRICEEMEQRIQSGETKLVDYDIDTTVTFYVHAGDPYFDNPDADEHDIDEDASLLCTTGQSDGGRITSNDVATPNYCGFGDRWDHNDRRGMKGAIYEEKHCWTFHEIYDHQHVPMKHMGRVGGVDFEMQVLLQDYQEVTKKT